MSECGGTQALCRGWCGDGKDIEAELHIAKRTVTR